MEEEEAASRLSSFHHHHHAHVTIHSLPHHIHPFPAGHAHHGYQHHHVLHAPVSTRASCHQCKSSKSSHSLLACSSRRSLTADGKRLRDCKKKFCGVCLDKCQTQQTHRGRGRGWMAALHSPRCCSRCCCVWCLVLCCVCVLCRVRYRHRHGGEGRLGMPGL
jgi:hypothetical protein